jgi:hypothetical protein
VRRAMLIGCGCLALLVASVACGNEPKSGAARTTAPAPRESTRPAPACVNGWVEPARKTELRSVPLQLLSQSQGFDGLYSVVDMRYFKGPDDTNVAADSSHSEVERWYAKVVFTKDRSFRLRFIARRSSVGAAIVAVAPFASKGFAEGDWRGFDGQDDPKTYPGLPGRWPGSPYDYVASGELPAEVVGCLGG